MKQHIVLDGREIEYELEYKSVKNINLRMKPDGKIYVSANRRHSLSKIEAMIDSNSSMILHALDRFAAARESVPSPVKYITGEKIAVLGELLEIEVRKSSSNMVFSENGSLIIAVREPDDSGLKERLVDQWMKKFSSAVILDYCRTYYPKFERYCGIAPTVRFRKMKSRWGSCIPRERILTFNTRLAYTPRECIEYVVVHELAHFAYADHSRNFYSIVESVLPDWKQRRDMIRKYEFLLT